MHVEGLHTMYLLLSFLQDMYDTPLEWEELVSKLINHKSSLPESDPTYQIYSDVLNGKKDYIVIYVDTYLL